MRINNIATQITQHSTEKQSIIKEHVSEGQSKSKKLNAIWLTEKNGISWGIFLLYFIYSFIYQNPIKSAKLMKNFTLNTIYGEIYYR